jgi:hypothetical protein
MYLSAVAAASFRFNRNGDSKLNVARQMPAEKRMNAANRRGRKARDWERDSFDIKAGAFYTNRIKTRTDFGQLPALLFQSPPAFC